MNYKILVSAQRAFFRSQRTRKVESRVENLRAFKSAIEKRFDYLTEAVFADLKRAPALTEKFELGPILSEIALCIQNVEKWVAPIKVEDNDRIAHHIHRDPLGVVCVMGPPNVPLLLNLLPAVAALAAGNTVVLKPSTLAPNAAEAIQNMTRHSFDEHLLSTVTGGFDVTMALLAERFDHIFFTGSPGMGQIVMREAAHFLTPVTLTVGGKNPVIVLPDADVDSLVEQLVEGKWLNCGQNYFQPDYLVVFDAETKQRLRRSLQAEIEAKFGKHPKLSPSRVSELLWKTKGELLYTSPDAEDPDDNFIGPHVIEVRTDDVLLQNDLFGPLLLLMQFEGEYEAIKFINENDKPMALYIYTKDRAKAEKFSQNTSAGGVCINGISAVQSSVDGLPYGGVGGSGIGRFHGRYGFETFTQVKSVFDRSNGNL